MAEDTDKVPTGPVLTAQQLADRWGLGLSTIHRMWRNAQMPAPFNPDMGKGFRWSLAVIEDFETRGAA